MKKLLAIFLTVITVFLSSCSKESKFGIQQFTERMNTNFETDYKTSEFLLSKKDDKNILFMTQEQNMISFILDDNNNIKSMGILVTADGDIEKTKDTYCQMCSIFTGNDYEAQKKIFDDSELLSASIKFADSNSVITVGRFKYTVVCNAYSITLLCDRV